MKQVKIFKLIEIIAGGMLKEQEIFEGTNKSKVSGIWARKTEGADRWGMEGNADAWRRPS